MTQVSDRLVSGNQSDRRYPAAAVMTPCYWFEVTPSQLLSANLAALQTLSGSVTVAAFTLQAGAGITTTSIGTSAGATTVYDLSAQRNVRATGNSPSSVTTVAVQITVNGYEERVNSDGSRTVGQPVSETFTGPAGTGTTSTVKTFRWIRSITTDGNTASNVSLGTGDVFGFPYRADSFGQVGINWNGTVITASTGFTAAVTTTATAVTGDVRGTYAVQSASDSVKKLAVFVYVRTPDTITGLWGPTQYSAI